MNVSQNVMCCVAVNCGDQQPGGDVPGPTDPRGTSAGLPRAAGKDTQIAAHSGGRVPAHEPAAAATGPQVSSRD
jgi:hypothetical protein